MSAHEMMCADAFPGKFCRRQLHHVRHECLGGLWSRTPGRSALCTPDQGFLCTKRRRLISSPPSPGARLNSPIYFAVQTKAWQVVGRWQMERVNARRTHGASALQCVCGVLCGSHCTAPDVGCVCVQQFTFAPVGPLPRPSYRACVCVCALRDITTTAIWAPQSKKQIYGTDVVADISLFNVPAICFMQRRRASQNTAIHCLLGRGERLRSSVLYTHFMRSASIRPLSVLYPKKKKKKRASYCTRFSPRKKTLKSEFSHSV